MGSICNPDEYQLAEPNETSLLQSIFIPDASLQGTEFPIHLLWDKGKSIESISIEIPLDLIRPKEIYNVDRNNLRIEKEGIFINGFEKNGYVGLVFVSRIYKDPLVKVPIRIAIKDDLGNMQSVEKEMVLFKPHVIAWNIPSKIYVHEEDGNIRFDRKIHLKNEGKGTALVVFEALQEGDVIVKKPEDIETFIETFCNELSKRLKRTKENYPQYNKIVDEFETVLVNTVKGNYKLTEDYLKDVNRSMKRIMNAFEENENFMESIAEAIVGAYLSAVNILTELRSFLEYLRSIGENRVVLLNAMHMLEFKPGRHLLKGELLVQDLAGYNHDPIKIQVIVEVDSNKNVNIPLYELFEWGDDF